MLSDRAATFVKVLADPSEGLREILDEDRSDSGIILFLLGWLNILLSGLLIVPISMSGKTAAAVLTMLITILSALFLFKIMAIHFFAELLGGKGSMTGLFKGLVWSMAPLHLGLPFTLIAKASYPLLLIPIWIALLFWSSGLSLKVIAKHYGTSSFRSALAAALPGISFMFFLLIVTASATFLILSHLAF